MDIEQQEVLKEFGAALKKIGDYLSINKGFPVDHVERAILELTSELLSTFLDPEGRGVDQIPTGDFGDMNPDPSLSEEEELEAGLWDAIEFIFEHGVYHGHPIDEVGGRVLKKSADFADQLSDQYKHYKAMSALLVKDTESPAN